MLAWKLPGAKGLSSQLLGQHPTQPTSPADTGGPEFFLFSFLASCHDLDSRKPACSLVYEAGRLVQTGLI